MIVLVILVTGFVPQGTAQVEESGGLAWTRQFGTGWDDDGRGVAVDDSGIYVTGFTLGIWPNQTGAGGTDAYLRKYSLDGNALWTRQFGSSASDQASGIAQDDSGIYVVGVTRGALPNQTATGGQDAFIRKYDRHGNERWTRQFGTPAVEILYDVAADGGGVYVSGVTTGTLPNQTSWGNGDAFVRKYDPDGNELWTRQFGSPGTEWAFGVAAGPSGVYAVGEAGIPNATGIRVQHAFIQKLDGEGNELWKSLFGTPEEERGDDRATDAYADATGVYVVGEIDSDAFVHRYNADGTLLWSDQFGTVAFEQARGVAGDATGTFVVGSTTGSLARANRDGNQDAFMRKYGPGGVELWTLQFGSSAEEDGASGLAAGASGVHVTGHTYGELLGGARAGDEADAYLASVAETPDPPDILRAEPGDAIVTLTWDDLPFDGRLPILAYRVYRGADLSGLEPVTLVGGATRMYIDRDVKNNLSYHYRVAAVNEIGEGPWSPAISATPRAAPLLVITTPTEFVTHDPHVAIAGRTEPDATVLVNGTEVPVNLDGTFRWSATLPDGDHVFRVVARNPIGLTSSVTVTVTVDTTTPLSLVLLGLIGVAAGIGSILFALQWRKIRRGGGPQHGLTLL